MDKYEYRVKTEQMLEHMESKQYKKAMEIADTIDWRRVKNASMLNSVSEIYEYNGEFQKSRDILFVAFDRSPGSRKIVYRLGTLALKIQDLDEASDCYEEFVKIAPKDPNQFILKYKILKAQNAPITEQIAALEDFKKAEYVEKWAYELALLYHEAGMTSECLEECDDLILWFSEGKFVYQAMELKMKYKPLTPLQQEKYSNHGKSNVKAQSNAAAAKEEVVEELDAMEALESLAEESTAGKAPANETIRMTLPLQEEREEGEIPSDATKKIPAEEIAKLHSMEQLAEEEIVEEDLQLEEPSTEELTLDEVPADRKAPISQIVKGATLAEALSNGVKIANGIEIEKKTMEEKTEELRITGQMKIEEILQEWEAKQKDNAVAIEKQKAEDKERIRKERERAEQRREAESREREKKAAEAAKKAAEEEVVRKAAEEEAARKAAEEEAARKAAEEEAVRQAAAEEAARVEAILEPQQAPPEAAEEKKSVTGMTTDIRKLLADLEDDDPFDEEEEDDEPELALSGAAVAEATEAQNTIEEKDVPEESEELEGFEELELEEEPREDDFEEDFDEDFEEDFVESDFDGEDFDEDDFEDDFEEDLDEDVEADLEEDFEEDFEDEDFEEEDFEEEEEDFEIEEVSDDEEELVIEEPSEEEIQKRIKKSKGSGVPFDTGFVVTGRYDLSATSEIGLKAGLTEDQKKLFSYFVPVRGMSEQIVEVLDNDRRAQREGTSKTGNIMVIGRKGSGKTVLAVDIVKAIQKQRNLKQGKVAIVTGESLNKKEISSIIQKLRGGAIIVEKAGKLNSRTIKELSLLMEKKTGELLFVLEDQRKPLERIFTANPDFKKKFTSRLELPVFINDELVTFGQTYAKENGYKLDEMGILALYSRIDVLQREDHAVTVAEVKEIMDEAIGHSQKANVKHLARRVFGKSTDDSDRIILKEEDFRI